MNNTAWHNQEEKKFMYEDIATKVWQDEDVFREQLTLNIKELHQPIDLYPGHWLEFIQAMDSIVKPSFNYNLLDVGCGCGPYIKLCQRYDNVKYHGTDFSSGAIAVAKETWGSPSSFSIGDYKQLSKNSLKDIDILHLGAVLDVLHDGDEALRFILDLDMEHLILGRVFLTDGESRAYTIKAYLGKTFVRYEHNRDNFYLELNKRNLTYTEVGSTFYIRKNNE